MVTRWLLSVQDFKLIEEHKSGIQQLNADLLPCWMLTKCSPAYKSEQKGRVCEALFLLHFLLHILPGSQTLILAIVLHKVFKIYEPSDEKVSVGACCCVKRLSDDRPQKRYKCCMFLLEDTIESVCLLPCWKNAGQTRLNWYRVCLSHAWFTTANNSWACPLTVSIPKLSEYIHYGTAHLNTA